MLSDPLISHYFIYANTFLTLIDWNNSTSSYLTNITSNLNIEKFDRKYTPEITVLIVD